MSTLKNLGIFGIKIKSVVILQTGKASNLLQCFCAGWFYAD